MVARGSPPETGVADIIVGLEAEPHYKAGAVS